MTSPIWDRLQAEQSAAVRYRNQLWQDYFEIQRLARLPAPKPDPPTASDVSRALAFLDRAKDGKNLGAVLVMIRSAISALRG